MRRTLILFLLLAAAAMPLAAQSLSGTVSGTVKDDQGGVLPGVAVTLIGKTGSRTATSDAQGGYRFVAVDPGSYSLSFEMNGFRPKRQDNVQVSIGNTTTIAAVLSVGGKTESIDVIGESPIIDASSSETQNTLSQDMLFNLPVRPTNAATDLLNYLPGVNDGSAFGGNSDYGNALLVDGVDTRDPESGSAWTFFNYNIVDEVQVGGVGANAEYGAYTGAVVNTLTKSGGNRYAGLFDVYYTSEGLSGNNVHSEDITANPSLKEPATIEKRLDLTGQISGPLIKDKLFFFLSAQRYEQRDNPSGPVDLHTEVSPRFNTKITWQPGPNDNISANFQWDYYNQTGRTTLGALTGDAQTVKQDSPEAIWGVQWKHLFSSSTFAEVKYTGWWGYYYLDPKVATPLTLDGSTNTYSGGAGNYAYYDRWRHQVTASVTHYADAFGKHDLKFGVDVERSMVRDRYGLNQGIYYYDLTEYYPKGQYLAYSYEYDQEGRNGRESLFAQDSWKPTSRLTINAGVRVDFVRGKSPALDKKIYSNTNWAPRIGFAFDVTGDGKTVLKGHYGQYYEGMYFSSYYPAVPGLGDYVTYAYDPSGSFCGPLGNCFTESDRSPNPLYRVDPDMKHPRVDEWTFGFDRALTKDIGFSFTGIFRQDKNVQGSVRPDARWALKTLTTSTSGSDSALVGKQVPAYTWTNRASSEENLLLTNPDGFQYLDANGNVLGVASTERKYKGLMFVLDKRFSNRWMGRVSYVWSQTRGYLSNSGSNTYGPDPLWETPTNMLVNSYGKPLYDRPHEVKVFATWQIPKIEVGLSGYFQYLSGTTYTPFQRFGTRDINYPTSNGRQPFLEARGDRRLDSFRNLDLRVEKIFKIGTGSDRLSVFGDFQNVFNAGTVTSVNARYPTVSVTADGESVPIDFGAPTVIMPPRRVLLGARWSF
ncbi:MAG: TonB-dependent receptor [Vicinamibacteria bacterium]